MNPDVCNMDVPGVAWLKIGGSYCTDWFMIGIALELPSDHLMGLKTNSKIEIFDKFQQIILSAEAIKGRKLKVGEFYNLLCRAEYHAIAKLLLDIATDVNTRPLTAVVGYK